MTAPKVPNFYLSISRRPIETLMDRSFLQSRARHAVSSAVGGKATLDSPVWEGTIRGAAGGAQAHEYETGASYNLLWYLEGRPSFLTCRDGLGFQGPELHFSGQPTCPVCLSTCPRSCSYPAGPGLPWPFKL